MEKIKISDSKTLKYNLTKLLEEKASSAINEKNRFNIALTGGKLPLILADIILGDALLQKKLKIDRWAVYLGDERYVSVNNKESNSKLINDCLFSRLPEKQAPIKIIRLGNNRPLEEIACHYESILRKDLTDNNGKLDLVLLGMGDDGHICSLFPNNNLTNHSNWVIPIENSPKAPSKRISFTMSFLEKAKFITLVTSGSKKSKTIGEIFNSKNKNFPAKILYTRKKNDILWLMDHEAASLLRNKSNYNYS